MNKVNEEPSQAPRPVLQNFHHQIVDALGRRIVAGRFAEGTQLPTEGQLAEEYGASRLSIREAMKSLAAKGLVSIRPRTGTHVLPRSRWQLFDPAVLAWHGEATLDRRLMGDLMELRRAIEPLAARLAAERASAEEIAQLRSAFEAMSASVDQASYVAADLRFHGGVVSACGNQFIQQLENALSAVWRTSFEASSGRWGPDAKALALHEALLKAIEARKPKAAEAAVFALIDRATVRIESRSRHKRMPAREPA